MPKQQSQKKQVQILVILLVAFACMSAYSFKDKINIPTADSLARLQNRVTKRHEELKQATREANDYREAIQEARKKLSQLKFNPTLEREAITKLDRILDDSNVTKSRSNVTSSHNRGKTNLQQVNINLDFEDVTMRKMADLFETFSMKSQGEKTPLYWTRFTISPRMIRRRVPTQPGGSLSGSTMITQRQLNVSATVSSFTLFPNASDLVFADPKEAATTGKGENGKHAKKGGR